jgi:hypothetical protein
MELEEDRLNEIVEQAKPGARVASRKQVETIPGLDAPADLADLDSIDVVDLRRKYLERRGVDVDDELDAAGDDDADDDDLGIADLDDPQEQLVDIEYDEAGTTRTKTLIVDTGSEEIIGEQG